MPSKYPKTGQKWKFYSKFVGENHNSQARKLSGIKRPRNFLKVISHMYIVSYFAESYCQSHCHGLYNYQKQ